MSSADCHNAIERVYVNYDITDDDHIPVSLSMKVHHLPKFSNKVNDIKSNIKWDCLSDHTIKRYHDLTSKLVGEIEIPIVSFFV